MDLYSSIENSEENKNIKFNENDITTKECYIRILIEIQKLRDRFDNLENKILDIYTVHLRLKKLENLSKNIKNDEDEEIETEEEEDNKNFYLNNKKNHKTTRTSNNSCCCNLF